MPAVVRLVVVALVAAVVGVLPVAPSGATGTRSARTTDVVTRAVVFSVQNANSTPIACQSDGRTYRVRGELVGPRSEVLGASVDRLNVLVHDLTSGSWFWHLRSHPAYDYAGRLAGHGETSLVLDRLGYDSSPLGDGNATCLGAQADMLHQVIQHARSGHYDFQEPRGHLVPAAEHVVVHGHSVGAAVAQVEAGTYDDVDGLVLMSWSDDGASTRAVDEASQQSQNCLRGQDYASFGQGRREFRRLFFATARAAVQRTAARRRNPSPCGDPLSLSQMVSASSTTTRQIEVPVLLLFGGRDRLNRGDAAQRQAAAYSSGVVVTRRTIAGAGNALPLERSAATTRGHVLRWLAGL